MNSLPDSDLLLTETFMHPEEVDGMYRQCQNREYFPSFTPLGKLCPSAGSRLSVDPSHRRSCLVMDSIDV
jgi:hypothetical protein